MLIEIALTVISPLGVVALCWWDPAGLYQAEVRRRRDEQGIGTVWLLLIAAAWFALVALLWHAAGCSGAAPC